METRHFYKHRVTGVVAALNDDFAAAFGDAFTRVDGDNVPDPDVQLNEVVPEADVPADSEPDPTEQPTDPAPADPAAVNPDNATSTEGTN